MIYTDSLEWHGAPESAQYILGTIIISPTKILWLVLCAEQEGIELIKNNACPQRVYKQN